MQSLKRLCLLWRLNHVSRATNVSSCLVSQIWPNFVWHRFEGCLFSCYLQKIWCWTGDSQCEEIVLFLTELFNHSMSAHSAGHFPVAFKEAFLTLALKQPGLDVTDVHSYRPISNLPVVSKLLEWIVAWQLNNYLMSTNLLPSLKSEFQPGHSTENAVLLVLLDLLEAVDSRDIAFLVLLDLSAAFDTVDDSILCKQLQLTFGLARHVLARLLVMFLSPRPLTVCSSWHAEVTLCAACLQSSSGSILGPSLFILYTAEPTGLIEQHGCCPHLYADDMLQSISYTGPTAASVGMHWRGSQLDAAQPAAVEYQQVWAALVCRCSPAASTTKMSIQEWAWYHHSVNGCARSWY